MANSVLYFPSMRLPESEWLTRVLLYWDRVGTILPSGLRDDAEFLKPHTTELIQHGLVEPVAPDESIWQSGATGYYQAFLGLIDSHPMVKTGLPLEGRTTVAVHTDKTGTGLAHALVERKLARFVSGEEWRGWFEVEERTADLFIAYLAAILGRRPGHEMDPITDSAACLEAFAAIPAAGGVAARTDAIRTEVLEDLLPAPAEPVPAGDLAEFKDRHRALMSGFRNAVEQRIIAASAIADPALRERQIELVKEELREQLDEITRRMQERKWRRIGLGTLLAVAAGAVVAADAVVMGGALTVAGATLGLTSAVYTAYEGARTPRELLGRPMAYAALAQRALAAG